MWDNAEQGITHRTLNRKRTIMVEKLRHREFIGYQVYAAHRALSRSLEATLAPYGLTPSQWNALNQLEENGAMTQKHLAELLDKEPATVARCLDGLEKRQLVERTPSPEDRRANIISITPEASELLVKIEPTAVARADQIAAGITDKELHTFFDVLNKIMSNANEA